MVVLAGVFHVPVEDAANEGRDERDVGLGRRNGLVQPKKQGQVAVDAFLLQHLGGADALPGGSDLDQNALAPDALLVVLRNNATRLRDGGLCVIGEARVHLRRDAAGHDGQYLLAEGDSQPLKGQVGHGLVGCARAQFLARFQQYAVHNGPVLRQLRRGGYQRRIGSGVLRAKLLHRLNVAGIGDDHGELAQLLQQILRHKSS